MANNFPIKVAFTDTRSWLIHNCSQEAFTAKKETVYFLVEEFRTHLKFIHDLCMEEECKDFENIEGTYSNNVCS